MTETEKREHQALKDEFYACSLGDRPPATAVDRVPYFPKIHDEITAQIYADNLPESMKAGCIAVAEYVQTLGDHVCVTMEHANSGAGLTYEITVTVRVRR